MISTFCRHGKPGGKVYRILFFSSLFYLSFFIAGCFALASFQSFGLVCFWLLAIGRSNKIRETGRRTTGEKYEEKMTEEKEILWIWRCLDLLTIDILINLMIQIEQRVLRLAVRRYHESMYQKTEWLEGKAIQEVSISFYFGILYIRADARIVLASQRRSLQSWARRISSNLRLRLLLGTLL